MRKLDRGNLGLIYGGLVGGARRQGERQARRAAAVASTANKPRRDPEIFPPSSQRVFYDYFDIASVSSVRTGTEPNQLKPKFLGA